MTTEDISPRYLDFELWNNSEALEALYESQLEAVAAVAPILPAISRALDDAVPRLRRGGRLIYIGAGTSGRIGALDGAELAPTFNWPNDRVLIAMAGGERALLRAIEGAEDSPDAGAQRVKEIVVCPDDVVLALAASGNTPFTVAATEAARARGAMTVGIANNKDAKLLRTCDHPIFLDTGAEPIAGSTRLKAGTAQKVVLNLFSTMAMMRLGKIYRGLMVDMRPTNAKLRKRAIHMVRTIAGCSEEEAVGAIALATGDVKRAALIARGLSGDAAQAMLDKHDGNLRLAMNEIEPRSR